LFCRREAPGWAAIRELAEREAEREHPPSSSFPALIVSISLMVCAATLFALIPLNDTNHGLLAGFGVALLAFAALLFALAKRIAKAGKGESCTR